MRVWRIFLPPTKLFSKILLRCSYLFSIWCRNRPNASPPLKFVQRLPPVPNSFYFWAHPSPYLRASSWMTPRGPILVSLPLQQGLIPGSLFSFIYFTLIIVFALVAVSFYTLYERKILGGGHIRLGPTIVGVWGLLQPFSDAVKLFSKEQVLPQKRNFYLYLVCPRLIVSVRILVWTCLPWPWLIFNFKYIILLFFILTATGVYLHLGTGWASNSNYGIIGALRCMAQRISYEVRIAFIFLTTAFLFQSLSLYEFARGQTYFWLLLLILPLSAIWWISSIAETNRRPFDFAEGESELVSGFNVEYRAGLFALLFIGEYTRIIFITILLLTIFSSRTQALPALIFSTLFFIYLYVWIRVSYPRTRYDKLIALSWLIILPTVLRLIFPVSIFSC